MQRATLATSGLRGTNPSLLTARVAVAPVAGRFAAPRRARALALCRAAKKPEPVKVMFSSPQHVHFCEELRIVGDLPELGQWKIEDAPALKWTEGDKWALHIALPSGKHEYKLVIYNVDSGASYWEGGHNRELEVEEPVIVQLTWEKPAAFKSYEEAKAEEPAAAKESAEEPVVETKSPPALAPEPTLETVVLPPEPAAAAKPAVEEPLPELPAPEEPVAELPAPEEPSVELSAPEEPLLELPVPEEPSALVAPVAAAVEEAAAEVAETIEPETLASAKEEIEAKTSDAEEPVAVARAAAAATSSTAAAATAPEVPAAPKGRGRRKSAAQSSGTRTTKPRARRSSRKPRE